MPFEALTPGQGSAAIRPRPIVRGACRRVAFGQGRENAQEWRTACGTEQRVHVARRGAPPPSPSNT